MFHIPAHKNVNQPAGQQYHGYIAYGIGNEVFYVPMPEVWSQWIERNKPFIDRVIQRGYLVEIK